jgi:hypothetical protein
MRLMMTLLATALSVLALAGCTVESSDTNGAAASDGGDATVETDSADTSGAPSCEDFEEGDPCGPEAEILDCTSTTTWCEQDTEMGSCQCTDGTWGCVSAGAPLDCHECCAEALGEMYYCVSGQCVEASGCKAVDCCVPGEPGTGYCEEAIGSCSVCQVTGDGGVCSPAECD